MTTRAEQETHISWNQEEPLAYLYTAHEAQAKRWIKLGHEVRVYDRDRAGNPTGWEAMAEKDAVRFRRVRDGKVVRRRGHGRGRPFAAEKRDQLVAAETHIAAAGTEPHGLRIRGSNTTKTPGGYLLPGRRPGAFLGTLVGDADADLQKDKKAGQ